MRAGKEQGGTHLARLTKLEDSVQATLTPFEPSTDRRADPVQAAAAKVGAVAIIPSPCEPAALTQVLRAHERKVAFAGRLSGIETGELLRLHALSGSDGVLVLEGSAGCGARWSGWRRG